MILNVAINQLVRRDRTVDPGRAARLSGSYLTSLMVCLALQAAAAILGAVPARAE
jgi:hypothetical protein